MSEIMVEHHVSDEDGPTVGWAYKKDDRHLIWVGEISRDLFERQDEEVRDVMGNDFGVFLVEYNGGEGRILARMPDIYTAREVGETYARGRYGARP